MVPGFRFLFCSMACLGNLRTNAFLLTCSALKKFNNISTSPIYLIKYVSSGFTVNPITLRKAKIIHNFGLFECDRVKSHPLIPSKKVENATKFLQKGESCLSADCHKVEVN